MQIVGIVGATASGKGELAKLFSKAGYTHRKLSNVLREMLVSQLGLEVTRDGLTSLALELRTKYGPDVLARLTFNSIKELNLPLVVIDGIRNPAEIDYLREIADTIIIGIDASPETRRQRYLTRAASRAEDRALGAEFARVEVTESGDGSFGQNVRSCLAKADLIITNEGSLLDLERQFAEVLKAIKGNTIEGQCSRGKERF